MTTLTPDSLENTRPSPSFRVAWDTDKLRPAYLDVYAPRLTHEAFWEFSQLNPDLNLEQDAEGKIVFMHPAGWEGGNRNSEITLQLGLWNRHNGDTSYTADSSTGYRLPNGATRSPDASWTRRARIDALSAEDRERFVPLCPDFVLELMSPSDRLPPMQAKMDEYIENGARLGLLIDRKARTVYVYRPDQPTQTLSDPLAVPCAPETPGLVFDMSRIF